MLNAVIAFSLRNRGLVLVAALVLAAYGASVAVVLPVDVFPDLNRPTVTVMAEAPGLAPEEVESLVTFRIESLVNGATDVERVRSASSVGLSIVWVEFAWGSDIFRDRQIVAEKLAAVSGQLPEGVTPALAPISSIMGEILLLGMRSRDGARPPDEVRSFADWTVRPRLLSIAGISQVTVMGGGARQFQLTTTPERLLRHGVTLDRVVHAVEGASAALGGGFLLAPTTESLIRIGARASSPDDLRRVFVAEGDPAPVLLEHVADIGWGVPILRGDGAVDGQPAVILSVQKQPGADTIALTADVERAVRDLASTLPPDVEVRSDVFRQADFIRTAIGNVEEAIRDGAIWVLVILVAFLWNVRTSAITLTAIPLSLILTALVFRAFGVTLNTMTLGGLAVAIGELVDDAIVDIENVYRRLRENRQRAEPEPTLRVVFRASSEVRNSIVYATLIVVLVVFPLFSLAGLEGRMFAPLGLAYLTCLLASLVVSLTVTPALASFLLARGRLIERKGDPPLLRWLKRLDEKLVRFALRHPYAVLGATGVGVALSLASVTRMGGEFLPPFAEGTLTVNVVGEPGTSLAESNRIGARAEGLIRGLPQVAGTARRTGRAEMDEHAEGVNSTEIDVRLRAGSSREEAMSEVRDRLSYLPGVIVAVGQPISHRLDHIMSGIRAQVAVKVFGYDLERLRAAAAEVRDRMASVPGVVDLQIEPQVEIPEVRIEVDREECGRLGIEVAAVAEAAETALRGHPVSQAYDQGRTYDITLWFAPEARGDLSAIREMPIGLPPGRDGEGGWVPLGRVARVVEASGPNTIYRENVQRRVAVTCNVQGRDLVSVVAEIRAKVDREVLPQLGGAGFIAYGGQFEAQQAGERRLLLLGAASLAGVFLLLLKALGSWRAALQCLANVPLAAVGSVVAVLLTSRPDPAALAKASWWELPLVLVEGTSLSLAHWIGFITLAGIVSRNGIMMISHYIHLMRFEGESFDEKMIVRGTLERLAPVVMTAATAAIGLVPLALGEGETGKELLHPLAIVVIGGLVASTILDQVVTPALFFKFGRKVYAEAAGKEESVEVPKGL
ncbi:MAG: efflux RND transporter permease subunit [Planctomycetales bacterium]|nr:efflux RND transporter permease subunit [Planctomycetales bacterium]